MEAKTVELTDEKAKQLRERISKVLMPGRASWCNACGAGAKALRELLTTKPDFFRELISEETITTAIAQVKIDDIKAITDWCNACGAGATRLTPEVGMPTAQLDKVMDEIVRTLGE